MARLLLVLLAVVLGVFAVATLVSLFFTAAKLEVKYSPPCVHVLKKVDLSSSEVSLTVLFPLLANCSGRRVVCAEYSTEQILFYPLVKYITVYIANKSGRAEYETSKLDIDVNFSAVTEARVSVLLLLKKTPCTARLITPGGRALVLTIYREVYLLGLNISSNVTEIYTIKLVLTCDATIHVSYNATLR